MHIYIYIYTYVYTHTSGAYVVIRQQDVWQETPRGKPCLAANNEALKKGFRRT